MSQHESENLVQIRSSKNADQAEGEKNGISRRNFLKILGSTAAVGATGCADSKRENIFPYVKGEAEQIPGEAVWYRSTCAECSAGCGIMVRTREGRAVKIEGSPDNPVNRGALCALGQSSLQALYDPDRVRQPLRRKKGGGAVNVVADAITTKNNFEPIGWDEAYKLIADALKDPKQKKAIISDENSGAMSDLMDGFASAFNATRVTWDPTQPTAVAKASELAYGTYGIPQFHFDKAEVVLNFGADFLETWVSPTQYARAWAKTRKTERPVRVVHVEPRLSLTAANADLWLSSNPGSETALAMYVLKSLLDSGEGSNVSAAVRDQMSALVKGASIDSASLATGIAKEKIALVVQYLRDASSSLVIAGGTGASTSDPLPLQLLTCFINLVLDNVGNTVDLSAMRKPKSSQAKMVDLIKQMQKGDIGVLFVHGTNPNFTLPSSFGFATARNMVPLVVSFSSHLDETAQTADLILPAHHSLESWGDSRPVAGVNSLMQPVMLPVFDTRPLGDMLIGLAEAAGQANVGQGAKDFEGYLKNSWQKLHGTLSSVTPDFGRFWLECVERGGHFNLPAPSGAKGSISPEAFKAAYKVAAIEASESGDSDSDLTLFPYYSVHAFDGRAANRPWLQETPDPMSTVVWNSWAEVHPDTAARHNLHKDDFVTIRTKFGEVNVPVYITPHVHPGAIAVPIGQGHTAYGRYAQEVTGGNVLSLLPAVETNGAGSQSLLTTAAFVKRAPGKAKLLILQGSDSQRHSGIAQTTMVAAGAGAAHAPNTVSHDKAHGNNLAHKEAGHGEHGSEGHGDGHHGEVKQMYQQRQHPLYHWGMVVDLASCTGCSACVVACYAENNIAVVGKDQVYKGREMSWLRIERYIDGSAEELQVNFVPMMCQQCGNAPCEPVCPVYATYHNEEGLNAMIYNRCVGTRYCSNNCSYKVRRFNWFEYELPEPLNWQLNPDVTKRSLGVMEKCTFCIQRITEAKDKAKDLGRMVEDGEITPACVQTCPTQCMTFGNLNDPNSAVSKAAASQRSYKVLDRFINTQPAITYLNRVRVEI